MDNGSGSLPRTKPIESSDSHNDLRVVWDATGTRIISDQRPNAKTKESVSWMTDHRGKKQKRHQDYVERHQDYVGQRVRSNVKSDGKTPKTQVPTNERQLKLTRRLMKKT